MLDPKLLRNDLEGVAKRLKRRGFELDLKTYASLESKRSDLQNKTQALQAQRNQFSKTIGQAKMKGEDASDAMLQVGKISDAVENNKADLTTLQKKLRNFQSMIPNLLDDSVPDGVNEDDNQEIKKWGEPTTFNFAAKDHIELGEALGQIDFESAATMSGSRFVVLYQGLARMQRALSQFMLDLHTNVHGYQEVYVPYLVHSEALYGTGQLPKFKEDQFQVAGEWDLILIPTAEVALANLARNSIIDANQLPVKYVTQTPCFRSESGSYGKDVRGMIRQHQFQKVEMVQLVKPADSYKAHEDMLVHAETVLQRLAIPYRVVVLCAGDTGFSAAKTYDLEAWMPGQNRYREISSVSNCEDFQARRMRARYRADNGKPALLHTLNASGLAVGRTLIAIMENYQDEQGHIHVPNELKPYMGGVEIIA